MKIDGYKDLTLENWLAPDRASALPGHYEPDGSFVGTTREEWFGWIHGATLASSVPQEVAAIFAVAQGALTYGWFYFPLHTLAVLHLDRALEAGIAARCRNMNCPPSIKGYAERIQWLHDNGILSPEAARHWTAVRRWRNESSHLHMQPLMPQSWAIPTLCRVAEDLNALFAVAPVEKQP